MYDKWATWMHRHLPWFPFQRCMICGKWFWAGLPTRNWSPSWNDYCSKECCDVDFEFIESVMENNNE